MKEANYRHEDLHEFDVLREVEDFYLARHKKYGGIYVIFKRYDGEYRFFCILLDKLFDIDTDKLIEEWMNSIGRMITAQRPYSNKFNFGGDEDEIL